MHWLQYIEFGLSPLALALLVIYHLWILWRIRRKPLRTSVGMAEHTRMLWVQSVMDEGRDILAVQTLRNWTMSSSFLASSAVIIALGVFNMALTADRQGELSQLFNTLGNPDPALWLAKLVLLGADFLVAFFNFTLAVRWFNHTGFMINLPKGEENPLGAEAVERILDRGALHYTLGMRAYYLSLPLALWLFGPIWFMGGTLALLAALAHLDRGV